MQQFEKTLMRPVVITGKGLHSGRLVRMDIHPAAAGFGIQFLRTDVENAFPIAAHSRSITSTELSTTIGHGSQSVSTIEHVMAALVGLGIDNAFIRLNAPEVPILDGSSSPFVSEFLAAGIKTLDVEKKWLVIHRPFEVRHNDQFIAVTPSFSPSIRCSIDFKKSIIGFQEMVYEPSFANFLTVAQARTFCHINDVNLMRQQGLALGGSLENAVVVTDSKVMNKEGLRSKDEFVRHKLLDLIGDLALLGAPILGNIRAHKPGHTLQAQFMKTLLEQGSDVWSLMSASDLNWHFKTENAPDMAEANQYAYG